MKLLLVEISGRNKFHVWILRSFIYFLTFSLAVAPYYLVENPQMELVMAEEITSDESNTDNSDEEVNKELDTIKKPSSIFFAEVHSTHYSPFYKHHGQKVYTNITPPPEQV